MTTTEENKHHFVPCFGHIFKAVFCCALIVSVINVTHIIIAIRHNDYIHVAAPAVSVFCYICLIIALATWLHWFFYPEFFLNALALPIKVILSVLLLFNSIDLLETNIEELYPSNEVTKDIVRTVRAVFVLIGVILELYVFRLCQKAHHLMKATHRNEARHHFHIKDFLNGKEILKGHHSHEMKEKPPTIETKTAEDPALRV